jgi:hypothetical protein
MPTSPNKTLTGAVFVVARYHGVATRGYNSLPILSGWYFAAGEFNQIRCAILLWIKISLQIIFKTISSALICVFCGKYFVSIQRRVCCCALPVMEAVS